MSTHTTMGIDPSLKNTGIAVLFPDAYNLKPYKCVITDLGLKEGSRLQHIYSRLNEVIESTKPDYIFMEDYNYKGHGLAQIGELYGVIKLVCTQRGIKLIMASPASVKKFATGCSQATKERMMARFKEKNEHIADAMSLAEIGRVYLGRKTTLRHELEVVKQLKNPKTSKKKTTRIKNLAKLPVAI